jgi:hypothetical protein
VILFYFQSKKTPFLHFILSPCELVFNLKKASYFGLARTALDMNDLPSGTYLLKVETAASSKVMKIVKL